MMARNGLVLAPETIADIGRSQARRNRWIALALWMIAGLLGWICYILLR
jgi:ubiquinone biosynthesis protein